MAKKLTPEEWWRGVLTGVDPALPACALRNIFRLIPNGPRCKFCNGPYDGIGGAIFRMIGKGPSSLTPQLCNQCYGFTSRYLGGAEIELTMLFADVRGSTPLAASMSPMAYSQLISRFFGVANEVFIRSDALLNRLVGDQVIGLYVPGFAGPNHRGRAIDAAQKLLCETGHDSSEGPGFQSAWASTPAWRSSARWDRTNTPWILLSSAILRMLPRACPPLLQRERFSLVRMPTFAI
jgi:adenylate cyclase